MAVDIDFAPAKVRAGPRRDSPSPIPVIAPAVAAFLGRAERGPLNEPVAVSNADEYRKVFGGHCAYSFLSYAVQHYFLNGGTTAIVVRLANGARCAQLELPAGDGVLRLRARRPGSAEHLRVSVDYDGVERDAGRFNLVVQRVSRSGSNLVEDQEIYASLSMTNDDERFFVDALMDSKLVSLLGPLPRCRPDATPAKHPGQPIPYVGCTQTGTDGDELTDYDVVGSNREGTGLFALDRVPRVDFLCLPPPEGRDLGTTSFVAAERYCERRRAFLIWDPPWAWRTADAALLGMRAAGLTSPSTLTYFPRVRPRADLARFPHGMPACGAIAGALALESADGVWRRGAADVPLSPSLTATADVGQKEAGRLHRFGVNTLGRGPGGSIRLHGRVCLEPSRTVPSAWQQLDTRRFVLFVLGSIERATRWVTRGPVDAAACARLVAQVRDFLAELHVRGALRGGRLEQAFYLRVTRRRSGADSAVMLRFGFAPLEPGRFEVYEIEYAPGSARTRAVAPLEGGLSDAPSR